MEIRVPARGLCVRGRAVHPPVRTRDRLMRAGTHVSLASVLAVCSLTLQAGGPLTGASTASAQAATPAPSLCAEWCFDGRFDLAAAAHLPVGDQPDSGTTLGFSITSDNCVALFPGLSCTVSVQFKPNALGSVQASLVVLDTAPGGLQSVALTGLGVASGAPAVTGFSPQTGYTYGGTTVTLSGINLTTITEVDFGGQPGTNLKCSAISCTVTSPMSASGEGMVDVQVKTSNGTGRQVQLHPALLTGTRVASHIRSDVGTALTCLCTCAAGRAGA